MATIPYSSVHGWVPLPIDSQDIVTKVRLIIAGNVAGSPSEVFASGLAVPREPMSYFPLPIAYEYEAPEHATYGATRALALPEGLDPFLQPTDTAIPEPSFVDNFNNPGSPSAIRDGDPVTYATYTGSGAMGVIRYGYMEGIVGVRIKYEMRLGTNLGVYGPNFNVLHADPSAESLEGNIAGIAAAHTFMRDTGGAVFDGYILLPPNAIRAPENLPPEWDFLQPGSALASLIANPPAIQQLKVYEFYPLILNEALLEDIAKSQVRIPAQTPRRVTIEGVLDPTTREVTITGWPGGDYTGTVARLTVEGGTTVIDFEQAGAPPGVPQELLEAERVRASRVAATVERAAYGLKMGERQ